MVDRCWDTVTEGKVHMVVGRDRKARIGGKQDLMAKVNARRECECDVFEGGEGIEEARESPSHCRLRVYSPTASLVPDSGVEGSVGHLTWACLSRDTELSNPCLHHASVAPSPQTIPHFNWMFQATGTGRNEGLHEERQTALSCINLYWFWSKVSV